MSLLFMFLLFLHILGAAAIFGGWLAHFKTPTVGLWQFVGAVVQVVTGLAMVGVLEMGGGSVDNAWVAVKAVIGIGILVAAWIGRSKAKKGQEVSTGLAHAVGGLALVNIAVATLWG